AARGEVAAEARERHQPRRWVPRHVHRGDRRQQQQRLDLRLGQLQVVGEELARARREADPRRAERGSGTHPGHQTPTWRAPAGTVAPPGAPALRRSTSLRMSFIGSAERTCGTTSKLLTGGGELVNHSSVFAFHGSGPATAPLRRECRTLTIVASTPAAIMNAPTVEITL